MGPEVVLLTSSIKLAKMPPSSAICSVLSSAVLKLYLKIKEEIETVVDILSVNRSVKVAL